jgi:hypothetical protein
MMKLVFFGNSFSFINPQTLKPQGLMSILMGTKLHSNQDTSQKSHMAKDVKEKEYNTIFAMCGLKLPCITIVFIRKLAATS